MDEGNEKKERLAVRRARKDGINVRNSNTPKLSPQSLKAVRRTAKLLGYSPNKTVARALSELAQRHHWEELIALEPRLQLLHSEILAVQDEGCLSPRGSRTIASRSPEGPREGWSPGRCPVSGKMNGPGRTESRWKCPRVSLKVPPSENRKLKKAPIAQRAIGAFSIGVLGD